MSTQDPASPSLETLLAQADHFTDPSNGAVVPGFQPATTFARDSNYELPGGYIYGRNANPTADYAEQLLAKLEGARSALLFTSGLSAFVAFLETFETGARVVAPRIMYHGGLAWLRRLAEKRGFELDLFDQTAAGALAETVARKKTDLLWLESPVNPTWDVIDIADACAVAHEAGALVCVDSTVAPPVTCRPLELGADFVFHSATKYLNGHSDVTGGVLAAAEASPRWDEVAAVRVLQGGVMPAFEAWLLIRGMRTLAVRFERASANALAVARHFENHAAVERVLYPGLESHPGHAVAARQMVGGFGGMLSLLIRGDTDDARRVASKVQVWLPATSLGGVESLIEHRKSVEGPMSEVPGNLLRLSTGIENAGELIADLEQALAG